MRAKVIKEDLTFGNEKAIAGWMKAFHGDPNFEKTIHVIEPFTITFTNETEAAQLLFLLKKHRIPFKELENSVTETLKFSDGMEFDTSGPLRTEERSDGWYVIGKGMLIPVDSQEEGDQYISSVSHLT